MTEGEPGLVRPFIRMIWLAAWVGLPVVEALGLSFWFDSSMLWEGLSPGPLVAVLAPQRAAQSPRIAVVAALATLLHGGLAWKHEVDLTRLGGRSLRVGSCSDSPLTPCARWPSSGLRVDSSATTRRFGRSVARSGRFAWLFAGLGTLLTWLAIAIPPEIGRHLDVDAGGRSGRAWRSGFLPWGAGIATNLLWRPMTAATFRRRPSDDRPGRWGRPGERSRDIDHRHPGPSSRDRSRPLGL